MTRIPCITGDRFITRGHALAAAACLRQHGWNAKLEASGPAGAREWRVRFAHPVHPDVVAYFQAGDRFDTYQPHWI